MDKEAPAPSLQIPATPPSDNSDLLPHLKLIADRHGRELFDFSMGLAAANMGFDILMRHSKKLQSLRAPAVVIVNFQADCVDKLCKAKGWDMDKITEVMMDIGRAKALAGQTGYKGPVRPS